ncbi:OmpA family protein [Dokdonia sp. Hel_I_53]|uniref:OmpA family protein n=1 Tax=Dokdonia sp. Hel_I_53 TaxID=1566287 RepID=UPI00119B9A45|nr:OmpA family protein [Dokdonia sp. Hel_I_53]TVZ51638.1 WD40 repeat protein [Dokdonia sp. Hel_I_53]
MKKNALIFILFISFLGFAQESTVEKGDKQFHKYDFVDAQKIYQKVADKGYQSADLFKKLADAYYLNAKYEQAKTYYEKLIKQYPETAGAQVYFRYAISLRSMKNYELSDAMMSHFFELNNQEEAAEVYQKSPDYLQRIAHQKDAYEVKPTTINSGYSDFGSILYNNKLIFASNRDTGTFRKRIHKWNGQPFLDIYQVDLSKVDVDAGYTYVEKFSPFINTQFHESSPVFTNDGNTIYFTRSNYNNGTYKKDKRGTNKLKIYKANLDDGKWSSALELSINSDSYTIAHPALSPDNKRLYFSSDMPGSLGMSDIWYVSINEDGLYGSPINLGEKINTEGRETFPFISAQNDLYFASDGHPGLGGLDLYIASLNNEGDINGKIINLGEPANTSKDDFAFMIDTETNTGFLSSNRDNSGVNDDIYLLKQNRKPVISCDISLSGIVKDKDTGDYLEGVNVSLYDVDNTLLNSIVTKSAATFSFDPDCGKIVLLKAYKENYNSQEFIITTPIQSMDINKTIELEKKLKEVKPGDDIGLVLDLNPIYFDFDESTIRPDAALELAKVQAYMEAYPSVRIDIKSHTDSRGDSSYNMKLSQWRNEATIQWLKSQGIESKRLYGKGYGESQLVNECVDDVLCSEARHQLNRRSEFIIVVDEP